MERYSVRLHGLGGQGLKTALLEILAPFIARTGFNVQAYPHFTGERRGAPVFGYVRLGRKKIITHSPVTEPDMVVLFDHRKTSVDRATAGLKPGGIILLNTARPRQFFGLTHGRRVFTVDARAIALRHGIGDPRDPYLAVNTVMAGAVMKVLESVLGESFPDGAAEEILETAFPQKVAENLAALREGKQETTQLIYDGTPLWPWLGKTEDLPRIAQPNEKCNGCNLCFTFCPRGAIEVTAEGKYVIREEWCDYCGACVAVCRRNAIHFITEEGVAA